jgi:hypothetical protein
VFHISTAEETVHAHQNLIHSYNGTLILMTGEGTANMHTNFITTGWSPTAALSGGIVNMDNNIEANDPLLWDVNADDFRLSPGSPARNLGVALEWPMETLLYQYKYHQQKEERFSVGGIDLGALE